jgi:hypothetical protein
LRFWLFFRVNEDGLGLYPVGITEGSCDVVFTVGFFVFHVRMDLSLFDGGLGRCWDEKQCGGDEIGGNGRPIPGALEHQVLSASLDQPYHCTRVPSLTY